MKIIYNNIIPFKGFKAMNLFGVFFVRKGCKMTDIDIRHELIHTAQQREMLYVFFYLWYVIEWLIRLLLCRNAHKASVLNAKHTNSRTICYTSTIASIMRG